MSGHTISLILATVGRTSELDRLFDSLAAQTQRDMDIIVVDQNADDRLLPHLQRAAGLGLQLRHLRHTPPNLAAARNAGIEAARGTWLGFPDDDCWYDSGLLARVAAQDDDIDGLVARWVELDPRAGPALMLDWQRARSFREITVSSITLFLRRRLCERIGGFDNRLGLGQWYGAAEETDLVLRALRHGARLRHDPEALVHHAAPTPVQAGMSDNPQIRLAARQRARGTGALYAKHRLPAWVILRGLCAPVVRPLLRGDFGAGLAHGVAVTLGRLDGMLRWDRH
jgi:GT2 family glycosyltransferase